jgi:Ankyrin repeats (3 copies)/Ankyrin repeats (many copies)
MFDKLKSMMGAKPPDQSKSELPEIPWVPAESNRWKIPILDVRPVTQTFLSTSKNEDCAANALSYGRDDGRGFAKENPEIQSKIPASLAYRIDRILAPGALFVPGAMEHKWAIYFHDGRILCIRSWLRKLVVAAEVECRDGMARVVSIQGAFTTENEGDDFKSGTLDFLLRTHALGLAFPALLPPDLDKAPKSAAMWCMNTFGNMALCATPHRVDAGVPEKPLRTHSVLHICVARGEIRAVEALLVSGLPIDLLAADGLTPLHWAFAQKNTTMAEFLLQRGSPIDVRSAEGATPLMTEVQQGHTDKIRFLLDRGADVNAVDLRGFSSLHRAAEFGNLEVTRLLLDHGARPNANPQGHTPISLAEQRGHGEVVSLLKSKL